VNALLILLLLPSLVLAGERKSPGRALLLSTLPGGGQFYNGEYVKGVLFSVAQTVCLLFTVREHIYATRAKREGREGDYNYHIKNRSDWLWWSSGMWALSMVDAYIGAHFYSFEEDVGIEIEIGWRF